MSTKLYAYTDGSKGQSFYWGEIPRSDMLRALQITQSEGYRQALEFLERFYPGLSDYVLSDTRIGWLSRCYDEQRKDRCLDLGSGWGGLSFPLTKFYDETVSLDRVPIRLEFQSMRAKQDSINGINLLLADLLSLPFGDNQFNLVVSNGLLEWAGFSRNGNPRSAQLALLKEIRRVLRPGGCLYIGIENRFGIQYWVGGKDHTSLPFTSIAPRKLADLVVSRLLKKQGWNRYYTYTYSYAGYKSLLKQTGFSFTRFYLAYPSYNFPEFIGGLHDGNAYSALARQLRRSQEARTFKRFTSAIAAALPPSFLGKVCPLVWPNFLIFAWKDFIPKSTTDIFATEKLTRECKTSGHIAQL